MSWGDVVVDHVADALNVKATGRDVGSNQDVDAAFLQRVHSAFALLLRDVAVDGGSLETAGLELVSQVLGSHLGAHEGDNAVEFFNLEDAGQGVQLVRAHDLKVALLGVGAGGGLGLHRDLGRVVQVLLGHAADLARHGGREQCNLAGFRSLLEDLLYVIGKAHAQHFVSFVQYQVLEFGKVQGTLGDVVDHAAGGTDNNLCASAQACELGGTVSRATVNREHGEIINVLGVGGESLGNLESQFTRRSQDQGLGLAGRAVEVMKFGQAGQGRNSESCGLAGTGLGEANYVAAFEEQRDGGCLDGRRLLVADVLQGGQNATVDAKIDEADAFFFLFFCLGGRSFSEGGGCSLGRSGLDGGAAAAAGASASAGAEVSATSADSAVVASKFSLRFSVIGGNSSSIGQSARPGWAGRITRREKQEKVPCFRKKSGAIAIPWQDFPLHLLAAIPAVCTAFSLAGSPYENARTHLRAPNTYQSCLKNWAG